MVRYTARLDRSSDLEVDVWSQIASLEEVVENFWEQNRLQVEDMCGRSGGVRCVSVVASICVQCCLHPEEGRKKEEKKRSKSTAMTFYLHNYVGKPRD